MRRTILARVVTAVVLAGVAVACRDPNSAAAREDFWAALLDDRSDTVRRWLDAGLNPNETGEAACSTPLAVAALRGNEVIVELLARHGAAIDAPTGPGGRTALGCVAAGEDNAEMVSQFLDLGADANVAEQDGRTPLMHAARLGFVDTVRVLLDAGVDLSARTPGGETAVDMAAAAGHGDTVTLLVRAGARRPAGAAPSEDAPPEEPALPGIPTAIGTIEPGRTWDELKPLLDTGTLIDTVHESPTRVVELRRINGAVYRLTFDRDGRTGPHRLVRITVE